MKKRFFALLASLLAMAVMLTIGGCKAQKTREDYIADAFAEAERINAGSNFGIENLFLSVSDVEAQHSVAGPIDELSCYYSSPFGDGYYRNVVVIRSDGLDLYGIRLGDSFEQSEKLLEDLGYVHLIDLYSHSDLSCVGKRYVKGYINIDLKCESPDDPDKITLISVSALEMDELGMEIPE